MLRNNLIVAWRNLRRYRMYTAINVGGLAAAFAVAIFVGLYVYRALTWDRFHAKGEQIYQVCETHPAWKGKAMTSVPGGLGPEMVATLPAVLRSVRTEDEDGLLSYGGQEIAAKGRFADPGFFELFSFPLIAGDPGTVLDAPNSIVLSKRLSQRLFGSDDPMGQTLLLGGSGISRHFIVTGVAENVPYESSLGFDWVIPYVHREIQTAWGDFRAGPGETYLQIADAAGVESAQAFDLDRYMEKEKDRSLLIVPLFDKRLHPQLGSGRRMMSALYTFGFVAGLVLLLACINYANLAAGMSLTRAHEVGVRKVVGAGRGQLMRQYFAESLLLSFVALVLAVPLTEILLPGLNRLLEVPGEFELGLDLQYTPWTVVALAGFGVVMGLVAGAYPALVQSRMQPVEIMQDRLQVRGRAGRILVVVQFVASTVFLTTALVVDRQVDHWESLDQGYDPRLVVCIPTFTGSLEGDDVHESQRFLDIFRREVLPLAGVLAVSGSSEFPDGVDDFRFADPERPEVSLIEVDPYFLRTLGLELVEGEDFPPDLLASGRVALVNQQLAATLEGPVVGSYLEGWYRLKDEYRPRIIGVVSDFQHDDPSYGDFMPELVISVRPSHPIETVLVRVRPEGVPETLAELREAWERLSPRVPFSYRFLDDHIAERFIGHAITISLLRWVTGFLVLIACLGVFGMASLAVSRRTKEVAVRKVLGASTSSVAVLLSSQSTRLVLIAVVVAIPLTYQLSEMLLRSEANRIELDLLSYSAGGLIALGLTWLVSGYHAVRAALANPVDSLRSE